MSPVDENRVARPPAVRVVVIIGVRLYRDGLAAAFEHADGFALVHTGAATARAPELVSRHAADLALLDVAGADGPRTSSRCWRRGPSAT